MRNQPARENKVGVLFVCPCEREQAINGGVQAAKVRSTAGSQKERKGKTGREKKDLREWSGVSRSAKPRRFVRSSRQPTTNG